MNVHTSFAAWMKAEVLPLGDQLRLDGRERGGNRRVVGRFRRYGSTWKVHADSHVEPLMLAFEAEAAGTDPFTVGACATGRTLELAEPLQRRRRTRAKHLYVYEIG